MIWTSVLSWFFFFLGISWCCLCMGVEKRTVIGEEDGEGLLFFFFGEEDDGMSREYEEDRERK